MADSLVLKGVKDVRKHTGNEMQLVNPRRGGNTHQLKQWWRYGVNTPYCACTLFRVTALSGTVYLAIESGSSERSCVKITHDGDTNFTFSHISQLKRAALYDENMGLIEHYVFPSIAGGPIMTVTPANGAIRPSTPSPTPEPTPDPTPEPTPEPTPTPDPTPEPTPSPDYTFAVTVVDDGGNKYALDGTTQAEVTASAGETILFDLSDSSLSGHPFKIYTAADKVTEVTVGIVEDGTDLYFTPPIAGTFSYQCASHAAMGGDITISA